MPHITAPQNRGSSLKKTTPKLKLKLSPEKFVSGSPFHTYLTPLVKSGRGMSRNTGQLSSTTASRNGHTARVPTLPPERAKSSLNSRQDIGSQLMESATLDTALFASNRDQDEIERKRKAKLSAHVALALRRKSAITPKAMPAPPGNQTFTSLLAQIDRRLSRTSQRRVSIFEPDSDLDVTCAVDENWRTPNLSSGLHSLQKRKTPFFPARDFPSRG